MIVADTSVWIDYFNGIESPLTDALDVKLETDLVAIGDIILLEVLQGFTSDKDFSIAKRHLLRLEQYEFLGQDLALKAAQHYRFLRKKGITVRKTNDVIIASFCIEHDLALLFSDRDFLPFVKYLGLKAA